MKLTNLGQEQPNVNNLVKIYEDRLRQILSRYPIIFIAPKTIKKEYKILQDLLNANFKKSKKPLIKEQIFLEDENMQYFGIKNTFKKTDELSFFSVNLSNIEERIDNLEIDSDPNISLSILNDIKKIIYRDDISPQDIKRVYLLFKYYQNVNLYNKSFNETNKADNEKSKNDKGNEKNSSFTERFDKIIVE